MNNAFFTEIAQVFRRVQVDGEIRVVVVSSAVAKFFSAGLDLKEVALDGMGKKCPARDALAFLNGQLKPWQEALTSIETCRKPVICCLNGLAIGGAIDLATACDIRFCTSDTVFSVREVDVGLAADLGTLQRLPKVVGNQSWVRDVCITARDFKADEALTVGFVSRVFDGQAQMLDAALQMASLIASKSPIATLGTKHLLVHARDHTVQEGLDYTALWNSVMLNTPDVMECGKAIFTKQAPKFSKL
ncbi:hypothetical protein HDV03_001661 [Kappamyces sp. JEL0829]|nr:hypothetical protein HDV03_001661 [Kappamyces sp. JEL0829]